jgi:uncharacterized DUF497 family protein
MAKKSDRTRLAVKLDWDAKKAMANLKKHRVSFQEGASLIRIARASAGVREGDEVRS